MNDAFLKTRLDRALRRQRGLALGRSLAAVWAGAALVAAGAFWTQRAVGASWPLLFPLLVALAAAAALGVAIFQWTCPADYRALARRIEGRHPELDGLLLTAVQQQVAPGAEASYLQERVLQEARARSQQQDWRDVVPAGRLWFWQGAHVAALGLFAFAVVQLRVAPILGEAPQWVGRDGVTVTPGDAQVERGDSLVVLARFVGDVPAGVSLVITQANVAPRSLPLVKSLADPVFGGSVTEVASDFTYHLEYRGERTREFKVSVFEHPRLVRADVALTFPDYTKLPPKRIEDTRRVSAVEGTRLDFALQLNKPVRSARLVARGGDKAAIDLTVTPGEAVARLPGFVPAKGGVYDLQLVDADGRTNKVSSPFTIDVQPNRPPELRLAAPRGDLRPSALEEITFDGTVFDDFGAPAYGIAYALGGADPTYVELGREGGPKEKRNFRHLLELETLGAKPDDLIAWFAWADDIGPDGKVRRTSGDLFFAEVRPFDEIFRESQNQESGESEDQPQGGQQARKLTEIQKQIISATWKLQRDGARPGYAEDAKVVLESQQQVRAQAAQAAEEARGPRQQAQWKTVQEQMDKAIGSLQAAQQAPGPLAQALSAEQAAYQTLLRMQARETNVTRRNRQQGGGGGGQQGNQRQIDELELQQSEKRYETQRLAKSPQNQERREQLAVMNRLQELARRQQDLNERLKELQTALQEARTEQERDDVRKRLKRLEEEQRQMLADADEVRQRMDRTENQSSMAEQREQLDRTREDIQKAADAAAAGSVTQALASGTRAQRQLQEMREEMRKRNSSEFAEDLRQMRGEARELAQRQEELGRQLDEMAATGRQPRRSLGDSGEKKEINEQLEGQKERLNRLVERATRLSEQAENTEPLLSRQLYDSIRKASQDDANAVRQARSDLLNGGVLTREMYDHLQKEQDREEGGRALDLTRTLLEQGFLPQARQAGQRAQGGIDDLKRGVERAAERVLGDDAEQLRLARSELDALAEQVQREAAQAGGRPAGAPQAADGRGQRSGQKQASSPRAEQADAADRKGGERRAEDTRVAEAQAGQPGAQPGQASSEGQPGQEPGEGARPGQAQPAGGRGTQPGGQAGAGARTADAAEPTEAPGSPGQVADARGGRATPTRGGGGEEGGGLGIDSLLGGGSRRGGGIGGGEFGPVTRGPLTGDEFDRWTERLRDVEELVESPELRNALAAARERARLVRREFRQERRKPDWTVVELQVIKPLVEVRNRVAEELARRDSKDSLAPIDRDPVPTRFAEPVRRYYEELGKDQP
jgi:hypothetical protein